MRIRSVHMNAVLQQKKSVQGYTQFSFFWRILFTSDNSYCLVAQ
jgi:hypothetical protein